MSEPVPESPATGGRYFAACTLGLEETLAEEVRALDIAEEGSVELARGGVSFRTDRRGGYTAALWLRTAVRLQEELACADVYDEDGLYEFARDLDWEEFMRLDQTLAVDASVRDSGVSHSKYAALRIKDAIVDQFRDRTGKRPSVDPKRPNLPLKLHLNRDVATIYRDLAGDSLHKRGYRPVQVKSPLNESIAAGLVLLSDWDRKSPFCDPMAGSGTIAIEAAWIASGRAPGLRRRFAFERWPDFEADAWRSLIKAAMARIDSDAIPPIEIADEHPGAVAIARESIAMAGLRDRIKICHASLSEFDPHPTPGIVITNPPYGDRLGGDGEAERSWEELGDFLRTHCGGVTAWVLSGRPSLGRAMRLKASRKIPVHNGPIECRLLRYEVDERREGSPVPETGAD